MFKITDSSDIEIQQTKSESGGSYKIYHIIKTSCSNKTTSKYFCFVEKGLFCLLLVTVFLCINFVFVTKDSPIHLLE